jgi:hypothetical protein
MATDRQIEANRRNGALGGPKTEAGKARSRLNATKHGMASQSADVEAGVSSEFEQRRAKWAAEQNPVGEAGNFALDRVVAATFRIERCEQAMNELTVTVSQRATLVWDEDRAVEAAKIFARLARDPVLASRQLQTTLAGAALLLDAWLGLGATLIAGKDWSESEASRALDLLGVAVDLRSARTLIDDPAGGDALDFRRSLVGEEIDRLEALTNEALIPLDTLERRQAMKGDIALLSKPAKLILRYERDAWKRYWDSMNELKNQAPAAVVVAAEPVVVELPRVLERPVAPAPKQLEAANQIDELGSVDDDDEWIGSLPVAGGRVASGSARSLATERTQFTGVSSDSGAGR